MSQNQAQLQTDSNEQVQRDRFQQTIPLNVQTQPQTLQQIKLSENEHNQPPQDIFQEFAQPQIQNPIEQDISNVAVEDTEDNDVSSLKKVRSSQQLMVDFKQNQKILTTLSTNIDDLFKKINSLTQEVTNQILPELKTSKSIKIPKTNLQSYEFKSEEISKPSPQKPESVERAPFINEIELNNFHQYDDGVSMRQFQTGKSLGHGKFGQVIECRHIETGYLFALKKIFKSIIQKYDMGDQVLVELKACKQMDHPNIIQSYYSFTDQFHVFLLMEHAGGKKLTKKFNSPEFQVKRIIRQVATAVKHMHENGVVHRDLKPENIIIQESGIIKICDFGWSHLISQDEHMNIVCGTLDYVCPEMVKGEKYTKQVDIWSVGVLTYELLFGYAPFKAENKSGTFERVKQIDLQFPTEEKEVSKEALDFMKAILTVQKERIKIDEVLDHRFLQFESQQGQSSQFDCLLQ